MVDAFKGLDLTAAVDEEHFVRAMNMSGDCYPALTVRGKRTLTDSYTDIKAMCRSDKLIVIDGTDVYADGVKVGGLTLSEGEKTTLAAGSRVYIFPDKVWVETSGAVSWGSMEATAVFDRDTVIVEPALSAYPRAPYVRLPTEPAPDDPAQYDGWFWLDIGSIPCKLYKYIYNGASGSFAEVEPDCMRIVALDGNYDPVDGAFDCFEVGDGVKLTGTGEVGSVLGALGLEGDYVTASRSSGMLMLKARINSFRMLSLGDPPLNGALTVTRRVPDIDMAVFSGNRIWGCSAAENRIYASRYDSPCSWFGSSSSTDDPICFPAGTPDRFTGAAICMGSPVFFKEDSIHKIVGNAQSVLRAAGIQNGCAMSALSIGDTLYYKSRSGVCAYRGSMPYSVSESLGRLECSSALAGVLGEKYYLFMRQGAGERVYVYDSTRAIWYEEEPLYAVAADTFAGVLSVGTESGGVIALGGGAGVEEVGIGWSVESGDIRVKSGGKKILSRITVRARPDAGAHAAVYVSYDDSDEHIFAGSLSCGMTAINIRARKSDVVRLYIEGVGGCRIFSVSRTYTEAGEF